LLARVEALALASYRALGCRDAGRVDVRCDAFGVPNFLEVNPLPGLHPTHSDLPIIATQQGMGYTTLIGRILSGAFERHGLDPR
jgi:D-alanine-D-alanine ligase